MKKLVIVESPAKAKTIGKYLGSDFDVVSCVGHIRDLSKKGKGGYGVDIANGFIPDYQINKDKKDVVKDLVNRAKKAEKVYLASDPDREGEAIAWHLADELKLDNAADNRVVFNEITKQTIIDAIANPRSIDQCLVKSQETRRILDRIIGFDLSKVCRKKIRSQSAGRVQSVALKLIVDREKAIEAFVRQEYWSVEAKMATQPGFVVKLSKIDGKKVIEKIDDDTDLSKKILIGDADQAQAIVDQIKQLQVTGVKQTQTNRYPKDPLITSTLQQEANNKFGYGSGRTMQIAQRLYEGIEINGNQVGLITYMRTDSKRLSDQFMAQTKDYVINKYGKEYAGFYKMKTNDQAQDAHEAIRPTNIEFSPEAIKSQLSSEEYKIYSLIYARAMACLMAPAKMATTSITLQEAIYQFNASGSVLQFDGYLKAMQDYESSKDELLPSLSEGEVLIPSVVEPIQHFSEPPARYNEARLIKDLEEKGIGRPSTYASIIITLEKRLYVILKASSEKSKNKVFFPTKQGRLTADFLEQYFGSFINVEYTSNMENDLDNIANCEIDRLDVLIPAKAKIDELLHAIADLEQVPLEKTGEVCPECGADIVLRTGRFGEFKSCSTFPTCKFTAPLKPKAEKKLVGRLCPLCNHELVERQTKKRGAKTFVGCSDFPKCRFIEGTENHLKPVKTRKGRGK